MQYIKLKEQLKKYTLFSLRDIRKLDEKFNRARLNEWQGKGYLKKIIKNFYIFSDISLTEQVLFEIANRIYPPSYVSLEMALSFYNLIPETVYQVTSVSTRRTYFFDTEMGQFSYRKLKPSIYFGYNLEKSNDRNFKIASMEKAILDFLYFHPDIDSAKAVESLRFNKIEFNQNINELKFYSFLEKFKNKSLVKRAMIFWECMQNA